MFGNDELVGKLASGALSPEEALQYLQMKGVSSSTGVSIGTIIHINSPRKKTVLTAGYADWENSRPIAENDIFRAYSITKTFTAALIHGLCKGKKPKLSLDTKVSDIIEDIKKRNILEKNPDYYNTALENLRLDNNVTIRDLLSHRSGVLGYSPVATRGGNAHNIYDTLQQENENRKNGTYGEYSYADTNYKLLGLIAVHVINAKHNGILVHPQHTDGTPNPKFQNLSQIMQRRILTPNMLSDTAFEEDTAEKLNDETAAGAVHPRIAMGYANATSYDEKSTKPYQAEQLTGKRSLEPKTGAIDPYNTRAGGGLFSTTEDLSKWLKTLDQKYGRTIRRDRKTMPAKSAPCWVKDCQYGSGAAFFTKDGVSVIGHGGMHHGYFIRAFYSPELDTSVIIAETYENITTNIAKELSKSTNLFKATNDANKERLQENARHVAADIRSAYSVDGKYDRDRMVKDYDTHRKALEAGRQESGTPFDAIMEQLHMRQHDILPKSTAAERVMHAFAGGVGTARS